MAQKKAGAATERVAFEVSTAARPEFDTPLVAYAFDANGELIDRADVKGGKVELGIATEKLGHARVLLAPREEAGRETKPTLAALERAGAYEPVLRPGGQLVPRVEIPGIIIDRWPFCFCWVRGRVVRSSDNRAVCGARVHICEVDAIPIWILRLPDPDILRLRDDLLEVLRNPPIPRPHPIPDPGPLRRSALRFRETALADVVGAAGGGLKGAAAGVSAAARMESAASRVALNPQPLPPRAIELAPELHARLLSPSTALVRETLARNWQIIVPWFCLWPWWWWRLRCDEVAVVTTDSNGRFEAIVLYACGGDHPDLYFWVEYNFGSGFETVYHPPLACNTYWNYACGTEVTIRVSDPRVPGCEEEPDLPGAQVVVMSIGNGIAVRQVNDATGGAALEGLTTGGNPFGGTLEPRVDFSRTELIVNKHVPYYRWSIRRLSGPDGVTTTVDPSSPAIGAWQALTRDVYRHYRLGTSFPSDLMGPMPTSGPPPIAPIPDLFRIHPAAPPAGPEWVVVNEHIDLATAYFETASLAGTPASGPVNDPPAPAPDDLAAGRYEMKLELFDDTGALVNWTAKDIDLRITDQDAPFPTTGVTTHAAPNYNRILSGADTLGFRMVVRVDNNRCYAEILPVGGDVTPDPVCGFNEYSSPGDEARLSFIARHPNHFATYGFATNRGTGPDIAAASTSGVAGEPGTSGFTLAGAFTYQGDIAVSALLGSCSNAAFGEHLGVDPMATNGYSTLSGYRHSDTAAFALAQPCECEDD